MGHIWDHCEHRGERIQGKREIGGWDYGVRAFNLVRRLMCDGKVIGQKGNEMG